MTSQEYYEKMDALRQQLHDNKVRKCEEMQSLNDTHKRKIREEMDVYESNMRQIRIWYSEKQNAIEHEMSALKRQWHTEHPVQEVQVINS